MQCALLLLRYYDVPRISHVLRAMPPNTVATAAFAHHAAIMKCLSDLLGPDDPLLFRDQTLAPTRDTAHQTAANIAREQATMPLRLGGLGMPGTPYYGMVNPCSVSDAAFLALAPQPTA
jgi:hypothetical protein